MKMVIDIIKLAVASLILLSTIVLGGTIMVSLINMGIAAVGTFVLGFAIIFYLLWDQYKK